VEAALTKRLLLFSNYNWGMFSHSLWISRDCKAVFCWDKEKRGFGADSVDNWIGSKSGKDSI
jgi:hypothetical protein